MSEYLIECRDVYKSYGLRPALRGVDLAVGPGPPAPTGPAPAAWCWGSPPLPPPAPEPEAAGFPAGRLRR